MFGVGPEVCGEVELIELQTRKALAYFDALLHAPKVFTSDYNLKCQTTLRQETKETHRRANDREPKLHRKLQRPPQIP